MQSFYIRLISASTASFIANGKPLAFMNFGYEFFSMFTLVLIPLTVPNTLENISV